MSGKLPTSDIRIANQQAWDKIAEKGNRFYHAADLNQIELARTGDIRIKLTPVKWVPKEWIGCVDGLSVLCLASGGGQQAPLFAAAGAKTTVFDLSEQQLGRDRQLAKEFDLEIETIQGDMTDLSAFDAGSFDLVVNPCSVCYCPDVRAIWQEVLRTLKPGGYFIAGFIKPVNYLFDALDLEKGKLTARHRIPYSDLELPPDDQEQLLGAERPIEFGHSLSDLIGQQIEAGFSIVGYFEDRWGGSDLLSDHIDVFSATRAVKPV